MHDIWNPWHGCRKCSEGWENIFLNVTAENQKRADERIPLLLELPFKHKGVYVAPILGPVSLDKYLDSGQIEQVVCGGENYGGRRPCDFDWVKTLRAECEARDITFCFMETGTVFIKDGKKYTLDGKRLQTSQALRSGMNYQGRPMEFELVDSWGLSVPEDMLYHPVREYPCPLQAAGWNALRFNQQHA